ncbi:hypothetical protein SAMN04488505_102487 [Chitinophaga rupis]|uniref:HTH araC/xylS-type domain-containing protein n=1 Tax=Chitinophaga rupis TaxID=573321 RepID=A0A1H7R0D9_9BACT|nr:helix-turn-helix domain-containing protein [Chitinophaga rupis]SEL53458.1 hypothetical protein SAMN04488505_102487 [Chitinophaga rupis]
MVEIFDNIRKLYNFSGPCPELSDYIEFFSESSPAATSLHAANECFTVKMFPSWTPTIWINLGAPYHLVTGKDCHMIHPAEDVLVLRDSIVTRYNQPSDHIFTVKFFPGGLERILGIPQAKFISQVVALKHIIPPALIQQVKTAVSFEQRMQLLQQYFLLNYVRKKTKDHYIQLVKDSIDLYHGGSMQYNTGETAEKMFVTSKTINRYFNNIIGISPKKYFSILRARMALTAYVANKKAFAPCNYGYYDMSHFYREMIRFTGQSMNGSL